MRLPIGLAAIALLGLLGSVGASTAIALQASNAADPTAAEAMNETSAAMNTASAVTNTSIDSQRFTSEVNACVRDAPGHVPDGIEPNGFCSCAVERMMTNNMPQRDAIAQCTAEARVTGTDERSSEIRQCVGGAPGHLPTGTDAIAFCTCAVDKMMTHSTPQTDAIHQCATEMHITVREVD